MLDTLREEVWERIGLYCTVLELKRVARTCRRCDCLVKPLLFDTIGLPTEEVSGDALQHLLEQRLSHMVQHTHTLRILGASCIPQHCFHTMVSGMKHRLKVLNMKFSSVTDQGVNSICKELPLLETLNLSKSLVTDQGMSLLQQLTHLRHLVLHKCHITGIGFNCVVEISSLRHLDVSGCVGISDAGLVRVKMLSHLVELNLADCAQLMDKGFLHLRKLPSLERLNLYRCGLSNDALDKLIEGIPTLKVVNLRFCKYLDRESYLCHESKLQVIS